MYQCRECGAQSPRWQGRCPKCGAWGALVAANESHARPPPPQARPLREFEGQTIERRPSGVAEFDRVLGGGLVPGSVVLVGGEPGIGKSTLLLGLCGRIGTSTVFVAGEESPAQVAHRARRLGLSGDNPRLLDSTDTDEIADALRADPPDVCVIDSVQTLRTRDVDGAPGGPAQVRAAAEKLIPVARATRAVLILVGQVTKVGGLAGPRTLEHAVDAVVLFEGDRHLTMRTLRTVKNRFGPTDEIGLLEMREDGLHEVRNPSALFLSGMGSPGPGAAIACVVEGRRALCIEVQALVVGDDRSGPRRRAQGLDPRRFELLVGVVESLYCGVLSKRDVYANVVGGLTIQDTGLDLALATAVMSAQFGVPLDARTVVIGEVGLRGEVRPVPRTELRLKEARALGFEKAVVPPRTPALKGLQTIPVDRVDKVLEVAGIVDSSPREPPLEVLSPT